MGGRLVKLTSKPNTYQVQGYGDHGSEYESVVLYESRVFDTPKEARQWASEHDYYLDNKGAIVDLSKQEA